MRDSVAQAAWDPEERRPLRHTVEESTSSSSEESSDDEEDIDAPEGGKEISRNHKAEEELYPQKDQ